MPTALKTLIPCLVAGGAAWFFVPIPFWQEARAGLLAAFAVVAAAVLLRLARGLPFTNADHFEVNEIKEITTAMKQIMRSLQALIAVILAAMMTLIFAGQISAVVSANVDASIAERVNQGISSFLAIVLTYVLARVIQVVRSDYSLVELQSRFLIRAVERKNAERFDEDRAKAAEVEPQFKTSEGFGQLVQ